MALVRQISAVTAARYGVNILEEVPPAQVRGVGSNRVAVVGEFPWGPVEQATQISGAGLFDTFSPLEFGVENLFPALRAFLNKDFPSVVQVVRVDPTGSATADFTFAGTGPADSVDVTARHSGVAGNQIQIAWVANVTTPANFDAVVTIGTRYRVRYENVAVPGTPITVNDPGDPFVTFTRVGSANVVPTAVAEPGTALTGGLDGTAIIGDYSDAINVLADLNVDWSVGFVAEPPATLIDTINTALETFNTANNRGFLVLCTPAGQSVADAQTAAQGLPATRLMYPYPLVKTINGFDPNRGEITVMPNSFAAVAIASVPPEISPGGVSGAPFMRGITSLEDGASISDAEYEALNDAGVAPIFISRRVANAIGGGGAIIRGAFTTSTATVDQARVFVRRMTDFIAQSIAETLVLYAERPLDIDLANRVLGPITGPELGAVRQFLTDLEDTNRIVFFELEEFSGNTQSDIDAGRWIIILRIKFFSMQEEIILRLQAGTTVVISEEAAA